MKDLQDLLKGKVANYEFQPLFDDSLTKEGFETFEFKPIQRDKMIDVQEHERVISRERQIANTNKFKIAPIVREHRGMNRQEELEKQRLIQEEVEHQLIRIQDQAYREGFEKGLQDGQEEVFKQTRAEVEQKLEGLEQMVQEVLRAQDQLIADEKEMVYRTIKNLTKWIILRELKDDGEYVLRLLEKLIVELQTKNNILIRVDPNSFESMPDILEMIQVRVGEMKNVRLEVDYDISGPGIVVESDNGIINGTLKEQLLSLSKLFENVGLKVNEEEDREVPLEVMDDPEVSAEQSLGLSDDQPDVGETPENDEDENES